MLRRWRVRACPIAPSWWRLPSRRWLRSSERLPRRSSTSCAAAPADFSTRRSPSGALGAWRHGLRRPPQRVARRLCGAPFGLRRWRRERDPGVVVWKSAAEVLLREDFVAEDQALGFLDAHELAGGGVGEHRVFGRTALIVERVVEARRFVHPT